MRRVHLVGLAAAISAAFLLGSAASASAGTLDQQQTDHAGTTANIFSVSTWAQTFRAGLSGGLDQLDLYLEKVGAPTAPLYVEVRDVSGGVPGNAILAGHLVPASDISATGAFVPINFAVTAPVVAGTQYAIVAYTSSSAAGGNYYQWWTSANPNAYPAGVALGDSVSPPDGNWSSDPSVHALAFRTFVVPAATGERAAALKSCKKKHTKRARRKCKKKANLLPV